MHALSRLWGQTFRFVQLTMLVAALAAGWTAPAAAQAPAGAKKKVFIDQDGAALGTDMISTLAMLQSPDVEYSASPSPPATNGSRPVPRTCCACWS